MKNGVVGLYDQAYEHDACGIGMLVNLKGEREDMTAQIGRAHV